MTKKRKASVSQETFDDFLAKIDPGECVDRMGRPKDRSVWLRRTHQRLPFG